jgi:hypothetical protein
MFFPILIPNSIKGNDAPPSISTLNNYTKLSEKVFFSKLIEICKDKSVYSTLDYAKNGITLIY